ncbi:disulfide bond formation protein B [Oceanicaulis sp. LC35]|uniref:disulfide bond formation protein B n=1 Tax=Oceanicaulis sp. LC35 TaxID=3349635 RepID=UPI003F853703
MLALPPLLDRWTRPDTWPLIGALVSASLLLGAFGFEIFGRYAPCPLCIGQRWAHAYLLIAGALLFIALRILRPASTLAARTATAVIAALAAFSAWRAGYHAGGEYGFWRLDCLAADTSTISVDDLLSSLSTATNVVLCDEPAWTLFGVSMAGYNALISGVLVLISILVLFRKPYRSV